MTQNRFKFTKTRIEKLLTPEKGKATYHDTQTAGFKLDISKAGTYTFYIYRKLNGHPERIKLGNYPAMTVEQARKQADIINAAIANGENPNDIKRADRAELTLQGLFDEYLERHSKIFNKSWRDNEANYNNHLKKWKNRKLSKISNREVQELHRKIGETSGHTMANRVISLLRIMFNKAELWDYFDGKNPTLGIRRYKEKSRARFLQEDEIPKLFQSLAEEPNETIRDYILISLLTGARKSNVLAMRWADITIDENNTEGRWLIPETKNGEPHTVPLVKQAVEILNQRKTYAINEFVFYGDGKTGHLVSPNKCWKGILERAGLTDLRIHDLRRSMGSWQAEAGASLVIIGKSLGHKNLNTTAIYAQVGLDPVRESMTTATNAMYQAAEPKHKADVVPIRKNVTLPIDYDVLEWFESQGAGYQANINLVLREYMKNNSGTETNIDSCSHKAETVSSTYMKNYCDTPYNVDSSQNTS